METLTQRRKIGFMPSYIQEKDKYVTEIVVEDTNDNLIREFREKIAEQILYIASKRFNKLSMKSKCKKMMEYNLLVKVEAKLCNSI